MARSNSINSTAWSSRDVCVNRNEPRSPEVVWPPWGCGQSPGLRVAVVGAWPVPWDSGGRRGGVASPLGSLWPPGGVAGPLGFLGLPWGRGRSNGLRGVAVVAWPVPWATWGRRLGVAGPLGFVGSPWWCGRSAGQRGQ